ncbi:enhancer of polycomb-like-domain-containing protein [Gongronella butleri]|nr:enhancer of polycomb-like-domain-containing protein [Gongronella butleri]
MTNVVSRFRVKKLSPKHPLPIYKESQLPDLIDPASIIQRAVPQVETGVEKEEEEEHDLQAAISAAQAAVTTGAKVETYIPTPDASNRIDNKVFHHLYKKKYKEPSTLIRFSSTVEEMTGCPYVMDEADDAYLKSSGVGLSEDDFEKLMWEFESITNEQLPHLHLDPSHCPEYEDFLLLVPEHSIIHKWTMAPQVYEHWRARRLERGGKTITPSLAYEDISKHEIDPYVCFRRRETKPVRKTRRSDQQSMERLFKLRNEMEMARNLMEMVLRREKLRKEGLVMEHAAFELSARLREQQRILGIKEDEEVTQMFSRKKRKVALPDGSSSGTTIKIPLHRLKRDALEKSPLQLQIEAELSKRRERDADYEDITENPHQPFAKSIPSRFFRPLHNTLEAPAAPRSLFGRSSEPRATPGFEIGIRKRVGRGGRIFIDRIRYPSSEWPNTNKFDPDALSDDEHDFQWMDDAALQHRVEALDETDLRSLLTVPFMQPFNAQHPMFPPTRPSPSLSPPPSASAPTTKYAFDPTPPTTPRVALQPTTNAPSSISPQQANNNASSPSSLMYNLTKIELCGSRNSLNLK